MILLDPQLIAFEAIIKEGTVHAAAAVLNLTQTAITQRLRMLEQKMRTTLFIRSRRGMLLTAEGKELHRFCQQVLAMGGELLANIHGSGVTSIARVKIAGPASIMRSRIVPQCTAVMKKFPNLFMSYQIDDSPDLSQKLKSGDSDLVLLKPEHISPEMTHKILAEEQYLLVCSSKWKHRTLNDIIRTEHIIDFDTSDDMTFTYLKEFDLLEEIQTERHFINNTESIAQLFIAGFGYGVLTKEFADPYLKSGELHVLNENKIYANSVALAWYPRTEPPSYFTSLINSIQ
ncbi:LysR family transcriptional regulator [Legionella quateirensis]|uniref:LysR family transcriptional regulator n=1 Tax=Legionella quateirensis TaxID=45072 RepID=A0A378KRK5_9GAMM|nr:LysR family transcriptional regulator [Legionella quateirensis]KTD44693.1 LysR family transcriptional regulator [Legionella quateirensis]STY16789.1 LysR family transcriptional regulator [Legionella quateirensis]